MNRDCELVWQQTRGFNWECLVLSGLVPSKGLKKTPRHKPTLLFISTAHHMISVTQIQFHTGDEKKKYFLTFCYHLHHYTFIFQWSTKQDFWRKLLMVKRKEQRAENWQQLTRVITRRQQMSSVMNAEWKMKRWRDLRMTNWQNWRGQIVWLCFCVFAWCECIFKDRQQFLATMILLPSPYYLSLSLCFFLSHWNAPHAFVSRNQICSSGVDLVCRINVSLEARERGDRALP